MIDHHVVPPPLTLRSLTQASAPALQSVYAASTEYFVQATGSSPAPDQAAFDLAEAADDDGRFLLGIYLQDEIIGMLDMRLAEPEPFDVRLGLILLAEPTRGQGLGSWALRIVEEWLRQATPTEAVVLTVMAQDHAAQRFFLRHGYGYSGQSTRVLTSDTRSRLLFMRKSLGVSS